MYAEAQRVQKAADVAASAGVIYMPQDITSAASTARDVSARNGYPDSGSSGSSSSRASSRASSMSR